MERRFFDELLKFHIGDKEWDPEVVTSVYVPGVHFHTAVVQESRKTLYFFGGKSNGYKNDLIVYHIEKNKLEKFCQKTMKGEVPSKRYGHSACIHDTNMYVFGGYDNNGFDHNSLYVCDVRNKEWKRINFEKNPIPRRFFHSAVRLENEYYIINGLKKNNSLLNDVWIIDLNTKKIKEMKLKKSILSSKSGSKSYGQQTFVANGKIYTYGGRGEKEDQEKFCMLEKDGWKEFSFPFKADSLLTYCSVSVSENKIMFFGGQRKEYVLRKKKTGKKTKEKKEEKEEVEKFKDPFDVLPMELINEIFGYITFKEKLVLSEVSKEIGRISEPYWEMLFKDLFKEVSDLKAEEKKEKTFKKTIRKFKSFRKRYAHAKKFIKDNTVVIGHENADNKNCDHYAKCVTVGDGAVGKTCLLIVFAQGTFPDDYVPTVFDNYNAYVEYQKIKVSMGLWDTAGEEDYDRLRPLSYPETNVFLICFSLVDPSSLENVVTKWKPELEEHASGVPIVLCGTKSDLRDDPQVMRELQERNEAPILTEEGKRIAKEIKAVAYVETSAKTGKGVNECVNTCVRAFLDPGLKLKDDKNCIVQ